MFGIWSFPVAASNYYASPTGSPATGTGTLANPFDLQTALNATGLLGGGDVLNLRGGVYTHTPQGVVPGNEGCIFQASVSGTVAAQLVVQSYPGEWARVDGGGPWLSGVYAFHANARPTFNMGNSGSPTMCNYVTFQNLEFFSSSTEPRQSNQESAFPTDVGRPDGPYVFGTGVKVINCVVHDTTAGLSLWTQARLVEAYGNVIYNCGFQGTKYGHGHSFYVQHGFTGSSTATIKRNISVGPFDNGIQMYGSSAAEFSRFRTTQNIFIGNQGGVGRVVLGTKNGGLANRVRDDQFTDNFGYGSDGNFYYEADDDGYTDAIVTGNYFINTFWQVSSWQSLTMTNNLLWGSTTYGKLLAVRTNATFLPWDLDRNTYYTNGLQTPFNLDTVGGSFMTLANWRIKTGYDTHSTVVAGSPTTNVVTVQDNAYNASRAQVAAYNWHNDNFIALDVTALGWGIGANVIVRNVQDYFVDAVNAVTTSTNTIVVDMRAVSHTLAVPYGWPAALVGKTFPNFGAFILERTGAAPVPLATFAVSVINSFNPNAGVSIAVSPVDAGGLGTGSTSFARTNATNVVTTLTAPATMGINTFSKWQRNGVDFSVTAATTFTNWTDATFLAVYVTPTHVLTVASSNPASGADIGISPAANDGTSSGTTGFTRTFDEGVVMTLTSLLALPNGNTFSKWQRGGVDYSTNLVATVTNSAATTMTAFYTTQGPLSGTGASRATSARRRLSRF